MIDRLLFIDSNEILMKFLKQSLLFQKQINMVKILILEKLVHELKGSNFTIYTSWEYDVAVEDPSLPAPKKSLSIIKKKGKDNGLRTKVLIEVNEDFHDATLIVSILDSGMIEELIVCFEDKDDVIRELASRAIM